MRKRLGLGNREGQFTRPSGMRQMVVEEVVGLAVANWARGGVGGGEVEARGDDL
jgi:hypothetical protein